MEAKKVSYGVGIDFSAFGRELIEGLEEDFAEVNIRSGLFLIEKNALRYIVFSGIEKMGDDEILCMSYKVDYGGDFYSCAVCPNELDGFEVAKEKDKKRLERLIARNDKLKGALNDAGVDTQNLTSYNPFA